MAYLRNVDDEEDQKQAPGNKSSGGGEWFTGSTTGGAFAAQPQQSPQQKAGSGSFTNFQSWLDAGKDRSQSLSGGGSSALGGAKASFRSAADPLQSSLSGAAPAETFTDADVQTLTGKASRGEKAGGEYINGKWFDDPSGPTTANDRLVHGVTQSFGGPDTIDWDPTQNTDVKKLDALSGTATAGAQLAGETPYSSGARRLDEALFGGDAASQAAIGKNKADANQFLTDTSKEQADYQGKVSGLKQSYDAANTANKGVMQGLFDWIKGDVDKQVAAAQKSEAARAGQKAPEGFTGTYTPGSPIDEGTAISSDQASWMKTLGDVLGIKPIQKTGSITPGNWDYSPSYNPNAAAPSDAWQANEQAFQNGAPVGEVGGKQSILNPGKMAYYVDQNGNYVDKETGQINVTAAQMQQLSAALASGEVQAAGGLDAWLKAHNMKNPYGGG